jgi:ATP-binding protein involved in chromosome partitioning
MIKKSTIEDALTKVVLPEEKHNIVEAGHLRTIELEGNDVVIRLRIPATKQKYKSAIKSTCEDAIKRFASPALSLKIIYDEDVTVNGEYAGGVTMVKNIIAVASGKGGVGKSTVTANLAVAMANKGFKVGLLDADIFGPSIPKMFGVEDNKPFSRKVGEKDVIIPIEKYGVKMLSIGFFIKATDSLAWRGPVASNALKQLLNDCDWGELDYLFIDTPPGTSDIHLTIVQAASLTGGIIVTTPQDVAVIDAVRGIDFFRKGAINVPIVGLVENMAWFTPAELPQNKYYIFGQGGGERLCDEMSIPFLGHLPIVQSIREGGDGGQPAAYTEGTVLYEMFAKLAQEVDNKVALRNETLPPTQKVDLIT